MQRYLEQIKNQKKTKTDLAPAPIYVLLGTDEYIIEEFKEEVHNWLLAKENQSFNSVKIYEDSEGAFEALKEALLTRSMFQEKRLVTFYCQQLLKGKNEKIENFLLDNLDKWPEDIHLLIIAGENFDRRYKVFKELDKKALVLQTQPLRGRQLEKWIEEKVFARGKKIQREAVSYLEYAFTDQLHALENELEKIVLFIGERETITQTDLQACLSSDQILADDAIFKWTDLISQKKIGQALELLYELLKNNNNEYFLNIMLIRQIRLMALVWELKKKGYKPGDAAKKIGQHPFPIQKLYPLVDRLRYEELLELWQGLLSISTRVMEDGIDWLLSMEFYLLRWQSKMKKTPSNI